MMIFATVGYAVPRLQLVGMEPLRSCLLPCQVSYSQQRWLCVPHEVEERVRVTKQRMRLQPRLEWSDLFSITSAGHTGNPLSSSNFE